ncbi:MAG TPA: mechanosensitive ion channel domain-containing protein [Gallionella sp.]|nr:mechanosensitive ion channel domain-containing protein [Gallionella sp.]
MLRRIRLLLFGIACLLSMHVSFAARETPASNADKQAAKSAHAASAVVQSVPGVPVQFADTRILVVTSSPDSPANAEDRAKSIEKNIQNFADSPTDVKLLKLYTLPEGVGIHYQDQVIVVITDRDAAIAGKTANEIATETLERIRTAVEAYRSEHELKTYGFGAAYSLLAMIGLWLALRLNNKAYIWLLKKVASLDQNWKKELSFRNIKVVTAKQIDFYARSVLKLLRILVALLCLYFFLPLILSFFPETHELGKQIFIYLLMPFVTIFQALVKFIPNLFFIFVIGVITFYVLKAVAYVFRLIERGELKLEWFYQDWARPTYQIVRFLIVVTALISAYPYIPGSSTKAFQGVGLVLGAIISFASSSAISNIVAGVILTYTRAFRLGDRIKVGETTGDVVDKTLLVTRVETIKSEVVTIPNSLVMNAQIINFSTSADGGDGVILHTTVTIGYDVPWKQVRDLLVEAARETKNVLDKPEPFVLQTALNDFYVSYEINAYTKEPKYMVFTYSELHKNILDKFDAAGVEIMSPHYYALRDGNAAAVPSILAEKGYQPPPFQVNTGPAAD